MIDRGTAAAAFDPLILWLIVILADALFAGLPGLRAALAVPLAAVDRAARWSERKLNREHRSLANRLIRGALLVSALAPLAWLAGWLLEAWLRTLPFGWLIEGITVACLVLQRRLIDSVRAVARALARHDLDAARAELGRMAPYDSAGLDEHAVARGAVERCAVGFCDGVIAPAFWYLLLGLPALCVARAVNAIAGRIGHPTTRLSAFGMFAARLDEVLSLVPGYGAGLVVVIASVFVPSAHPVRALRGWVSAITRSGVLDGGRARGAAAGALGLALGGPRRIDGIAVRSPWIGDGRARATRQDVTRAVVLFAASSLLFAAVLGAALVARARL